MGTRYHITFKSPERIDTEALHKQLQKRLEAINRSMSTWRDDSLISAFNNAPVDEPVTVDNDFHAVMAISRQVYDASNGAFNPGVAELVELWGFGSKLTIEQLQKMPHAEAIHQAIGHSQFTAIERQGQQLVKRAPVRLDFSAVAKGYAVDALAALLQDWQIRDYMVEIGGEVATAGNSPRGGQWRIGIESPAAGRGRTQSAISVNQAAMATSGDYRQFFEMQGKRYSHTIDPRSGRPVEHDLTSVTVLADTVARADAFATAMMVLGQEQAMALAEREKLAVYLIYRDGDELAGRYNKRMAAYLNPDKH